MVCVRVWHQANIKQDIKLDHVLVQGVVCWMSQLAEVPQKSQL